MSIGITWYVYEPTDWKKRMGYDISTERCRYAVHEEGRGVGFHQCSRKPKEEIQGYEFCSLHARVVREGLKRG